MVAISLQSQKLSGVLYSFFASVFIALVVMEWKTVYLYSNGVNLKKKNKYYYINILFFTIV